MVEMIITDEELLWPEADQTIKKTALSEDLSLRWSSIFMAIFLIAGSVTVYVTPPQKAVEVISSLMDRLDRAFGEETTPVIPVSNPRLPEVPVAAVPDTTLVATVTENPSLQLSQMPNQNVAASALPELPVLKKVIEPDTVAAIQLPATTKRVIETLPVVTQTQQQTNPVPAQVAAAKKPIPIEEQLIPPLQPETTDGCLLTFRRGVVSSAEIGLTAIKKDVASFKECTVHPGTKFGKNERVELIDPEKMIIRTNRRVLTIVD